MSHELELPDLLYNTDNKDEYQTLLESFGGPNVTRARAMHIVHNIRCLRKLFRGEVHNENLLDDLMELPNTTHARAYHIYHTIQSLRKILSVYGR